MRETDCLVATFGTRGEFFIHKLLCKSTKETFRGSASIHIGNHQKADNRAE